MREFSYSANLGFLWADLPLAEAIRAAAAAGFSAVECHWPFEGPVSDVRNALRDTGLLMLSLNTRAGEAGEFGLAALAGRETDARAAIDEAITYARAIGAKMVHVMAGLDGDQAVFASNLTYACSQAADLTILIEPINPHDVPGYALSHPNQALELIEELGLPNLKMMFDCYHIARLGLDVLATAHHCRSSIAHVQFAGVPHRGSPDEGDLNYAEVFSGLREMGLNGPYGAEFRPEGVTEDSLGWLR